MMLPTRFIEKATGMEVLVETVFAWEPYDKISIITYPSGRRYAMPDAELGKYFEFIRPQEVFVKAFGGCDDRPLKEQRLLLAQESA